MIPEPDQVFTEIELSTLEKAIKETEVSATTGGAHNVGGPGPRERGHLWRAHKKEWRNSCLCSNRQTWVQELHLIPKTTGSFCSRTC